jgi:hypothetical protein
MKFAVIAAICAAGFLPGCTSLGQAYPFPTRNEPSALLQAQGQALFLLTVDEKGCYVGKTRLPRSAAVTPVKVVPNQRLLVAYENSCLLTAAFTPRAGAHYWLTAVEGPVPDKPDATFFQAFIHAKDRQCVMGVTEMDEATQQLTPVQLRKVLPHQKSLTCIKLD